jgi:beta-fructofuranosidase
MTNERGRPLLHFTARQGWTNDPHGIVLVDGQFHMFFQYNPDGLAWHQACHWGQAVSQDLITWEEVEVALTPTTDEIGCWSGSAVIDQTGPVLAYTRIAEDDWGRGSVALARPDEPMRSWRRQPGGAVLAGPPEDLDIIAFRDPQIRRRGDDWVAVIGAGLVGHGGCALQYGVSADLTEWTLEGILATRSNAAREPVWSGKVWECPQFLQVDGEWVLIVSVWEDDFLYNVVYAIGDYDGLTFDPRSWGRLSHGPQLYATTTFADANGRPTAMSWMREQDNTAPAGSPWCSAMSLPHCLSITDGRLVLTQHPNLDTHFGHQAAQADLGRGDHLSQAIPADTPVRIRADLTSDCRLEIRMECDEGPWALIVDSLEGHLDVRDSVGAVLMTIPSVVAGPGHLDVVVDADILEITWSSAEGVGAVRVTDGRRRTLSASVERGLSMKTTLALAVAR